MHVRTYVCTHYCMLVCVYVWMYTTNRTMPRCQGKNRRKGSNNAHGVSGIVGSMLLRAVPTFPRISCSGGTIAVACSSTALHNMVANVMLATHCFSTLNPRPCVCFHPCMFPSWLGAAEPCTFNPEATQARNKTAPYCCVSRRGWLPKHTYMCIYIHIYIYGYTYTLTYIYVHIYIYHRHIHIYTYSQGEYVYSHMRVCIF